MGCARPCCLVGTRRNGPRRRRERFLRRDPGAVPRLAWHRCDNPADRGFQCATARVPLDYRHPGRAKIKLAAIRHRASDSARLLGRFSGSPADLEARARVSALCIRQGLSRCVARSLRHRQLAPGRRGCEHRSPVLFLRARGKPLLRRGPDEIERGVPGRACADEAMDSALSTTRAALRRRATAAFCACLDGRHREGSGPPASRSGRFDAQLHRDLLRHIRGRHLREHLSEPSTSDGAGRGRQSDSVGEPAKEGERRPLPDHRVALTRGREHGQDAPRVPRPLRSRGHRSLRVLCRQPGRHPGEVLDPASADAEAPDRRARELRRNHLLDGGRFVQPRDLGPDGEQPREAVDEWRQERLGAPAGDTSLGTISPRVARERSPRRGREHQVLRPGAGARDRLRGEHPTRRRARCARSTPLRTGDQGSSGRTGRGTTSLVGAGLSRAQIVTPVRGTAEPPIRCWSSATPSILRPRTGAPSR